MTRIVPTVLVALALVWGGPSPLEGQELLTPGSTVRLTVADSVRPFTGVLLFVTDDAMGLSLPDGQMLGIDPRSVTEAEVQVTRQRSPLGILIGGGIGLATGLLVVAASGDECGNDLSSLCDLSAGAVLVGGTAVGALVGNLIASTRWVPAVVPGGGRSVVAFRWSLPTGR